MKKSYQATLIPEEQDEEPEIENDKEERRRDYIRSGSEEKRMRTRKKTVKYQIG